MPQVSVLMTVYNAMPYLIEAVESVRLQTLSDWQLVVVDDGSTDGSGAWLDTLDDPRILVVHQRNAGAPAAANRGLALCEAPLVARLDADDVAHPRRLELQREFFLAHPRVGLAGTQVAPLGSVRAGRGLSLPLDHESIVSALMTARHGICHSSVMVRTHLLNKVGGYWQQGVAEDCDMFLRVAEHAQLANLSELLLHFRILPGSLQSRSMKEVRSRFAYVAESAHRRRHRLPSISYEAFRQRRAARPWWQRFAETVEVHAMAQYRQAQYEVLGTRPLLGYARLAWAAACSPERTLHRVARVVRHRFQPRRPRPSGASSMLRSEIETTSV